MLKAALESLRRHLWWAVAFLPILAPAYLVRFKFGPLPTTALEIILGVLFVLFTLAFGWRGWMKAAQKLSVFRLPILVFGMASFVAALWSPDIYSGLGLWRAYVLEPLLLFSILVHEFEDPHRRGFLRLSLYALVWALAAWGLFEYLTGQGIPAPWNMPLGAGRRATGPFPFPNALALLTAPIEAYAFARFARSPGSALSLLTFGAALLAALVARSDGAALALVGVATLLLLIEKRFRLIGIGLILVGILTLVSLPALRAEVWQEVSFQSWSGRVRVWMWDETLQMLRDRPITGAGMGGYPIVVAPYHGHDFIEIFQYPHSLVLNFWTETGLFGLIAFVWILFLWLREARLSGKEYWYASLAIVGALFIHGFVDVPYFKNDLALVFLMLLFLSVGRLDQEPKRG